MSVLPRSRTLRGTPVVPTPRPPTHDGGLAPVAPRGTAVAEDRTSRRRRAALVLVALVAAIVAAAATAFVQLTGGDEPTRLAPSSQLGGVTELDDLRDEALLRRQLMSDAHRASDAARDAALSTR